MAIVATQEIDFTWYLRNAWVQGLITETILFPTANAAAKALMPASYRDSPVIFPPAAELTKCEYAKYRPDVQPLYEEAFARVRARSAIPSSAAGATTRLRSSGVHLIRHHPS